MAPRESDVAEAQQQPVSLRAANYHIHDGSPR
jgi:hypothetical protein